MKKIKAILLITAAVFAFGSCSDWLDVNENPNYISDLQAPNVVIPVAQVNIANGIMGWDMGFAGAFWSQYWTQAHNASQFKYLDEYKETSFNNSYSNLVPYALNDLKKVLSIAPKGTGEYFIAEVLSIYTWQIITDVWGDIPYFEALQGDEGEFSPAFDTQADIYNDLMLRINELLTDDYSAAVMASEYDFVYEGEMSDWIKFAKSLKLKLMLRLSETTSYNNAALLALVNEGGFITTNALIPGTIWENKDGKQHPMVEYEAGGAGYLGTNVIASKTFISYLEDSIEDPRIDVYFTPTSGGHKGAFQGDFASKVDSDGNGTNDDKEDYSTVSFASDSDIPLMSIWEVNFYIAEVYARAGDNVNAKIYFDAAVQASFDYWGVSNSITVPGGKAEWRNGTIEEGIEQIALQKWVSYCKLQHIEAFIEHNRTKYPAVNAVDVDKNRTETYTNFPAGEFTLSVEGRAKLSEKLPASPIYPNSVVTRNATDPKQKVNLGEKVWWDQKADIFRQ